MSAEEENLELSRKIDELLEDLDDIASTYYPYKCGLPMSDANEKTKMRVCVLNWLRELQ